MTFYRNTNSLGKLERKELVGFISDTPFKHFFICVQPKNIYIVSDYPNFLLVIVD